jgi:hypothetical protein
MAEEVKTSWSPNYILLTVTLSFFTGVLGYGLKYIFERRPSRVITVSEELSKNLIDLDERARTGLIATYRLKDVPNQELRSYFEYKVTVKNAGDEGVEALVVSIEDKTEGLVVPKAPTVATLPPEVKTGLHLSQNKELGPNLDEWTVALLNPGEAVELTYVGYSVNRISQPSFSAIARKKDWQTVRAGQVLRSQERSPLSKPLSELRGFDILYILVMFLTLQFVFNIYLAFFLQMPPVRRMLERWRSN